MVGQRRHRRVSRGERTETGCEPRLTGCVQTSLPAEEDHLVAQQREANRRNRGVVEFVGQIDATDLRTDPSRHLPHVQPSSRNHVTAGSALENAREGTNGDVLGWVPDGCVGDLGHAKTPSVEGIR